MLLGAQLYTVREYTKNLDDFADTLKRVADIGYTAVQVSGTCAYDATWLKEQLDKTGLKCAITHTSPDRIAARTDAVIAEHKTFGCRYIGIGSMPGGLKGGMADYDAFVEKFRPVSRHISGQGLYLMYHNHNMEFAKHARGRVYLACLAEDFAPGELGFTVDTYWVQAGGGDPAWWIRQLCGRVPCVHLKDMAYENGNIRMAPVGEGNMNFDGILAACEEAGVEYLLVEQDHCYGENPFDYLKRSYQNLSARGLK